MKRLALAVGLAIASLSLPACSTMHKIGDTLTTAGAVVHAATDDFAAIWGSTGGQAADALGLTPLAAALEAAEPEPAK